MTTIQKRVRYVFVSPFYGSHSDDREFYTDASFCVLNFTFSLLWFP